MFKSTFHGREFYPSPSKKFSGFCNFANKHPSINEFSKISAISSTGIDLTGVITRPHTMGTGFISAEPIYMDIDFHSLRYILYSYDFETMESSTPPVNWSLIGFNEEDGPHYNIHSQFKDDLCTGRTDNPWQCQNREQWNFSVTNILGPFRYLRFFIHEERRSYYNPGKYDDNVFRIGGLDFYGQFCVMNEKGICSMIKITFSNSKLNFTLKYLITTIILQN